MTRKAFALLLAVAQLFASFALASPPPKVTFVFHNQSGATVYGVSATTNYSQNPDGFSGSVTALVGTVANGASASASFGSTFEQRNMEWTRVSWQINGSNQDSTSPNAWTHYWGSWTCTNCPYQYKLDWDSYTVHFTIQKR